MAAGHAGRVVVVGNLKGGTGKSTVAVNLACAAAARGVRVALLDADPQATSAEWLARGGLPVWPVHLPVAGLAETERWRQQLEAMRMEHDLVVVDLPSVVAPVLAAAFLFATLILIPASVSAVDIAGTRRVLRYIEAARRERPHRPPLALLVPTRTVGTSAEEMAATQALHQLGWPVGPGLSFDRAHDQAFADGCWVGQRGETSLAAQQVAALADRVMDILERGAEAMGDLPGQTGSTGAKAPRRLRPQLGRDAQARALVPGLPAILPVAWWRRLAGGRV